MSQELLFLEPIFKEKIWGGGRLKQEFGYPVPFEKTGECWAVSARQDGDCRVISKTYRDWTLSELWNRKRQLFGNLPGDQFPLLIKILDAREDLSIQVHPDDTYARLHENGQAGKSECWYILDCEPGASVILGHRAANRQELRKLVLEKRWEELVQKIPVHKGDFFQIDPGSIHSIGGGILILEIQQNSDLTYRVYDFDRLDDKAPRELQLEQSLEVMQAPYRPVPIEAKTISGRNYRRTELYQCRHYSVGKLETFGHTRLETGNFICLSVIGGNGWIDGVPLEKGDHLIIPNGYGSFILEGKLTIITSAPGVRKAVAQGY